MTETEQIKHDFFQLCYSKQRVLIDAGELDYWGLSEENRKGIVNQCKEEAEKYPDSQWIYFTSSNHEKSRKVKEQRLTFCNPFLYYRRLDPLPTEEESEVAELKATIKMLQKNLAEKHKVLKLIAGDLEEKHKELRQVEDILHLESTAVSSALANCDKYKERIKYLEEELGNLRESHTQYTIQTERIERENTALLRDIHKLAMHITN